MRRGGRILLFLVVIIVILVAVTFLAVGPLKNLVSPPASPTPSNVKVYVVGQKIERDHQIDAASLSTIDLPENLVAEWMIRDQEKVVGKYAAYPLEQGMLLSSTLVSDRPGAQGSEAARLISPGLVAISIPINRINSVAYAIRDGDHVNVIATTMFVDLDASFQSVLPNNLGQVKGPGGADSSSSIVAGGSGPYGRIDLDPTLNQAIYVVPSEAQRPRLVSQMVLQNIQVLHIGTFPLVSTNTVEATPDPNKPAPTPAPVASPDIIILIVTPQDAVSLTYLLHSGTDLTLTLRAPDDESRPETEAATLQYLLSQYAIPVPAKLPYGIQPRLDKLPVATEAAPAPK
jgi:Flp pilus assembly protein CpaB